jgi:hypothetical protein
LKSFWQGQAFALSYTSEICFRVEMKRRPTPLELEAVMLGTLIVGSLVWGLFSGIASLIG